jgi:hypothetical protein
MQRVLNSPHNRFFLLTETPISRPHISFSDDFNVLSLSSIGVVSEKFLVEIKNGHRKRKSNRGKNSGD